MKRRDLLRHLTLLGCRLLREGVVIPGGTIRSLKSEVPFRGTRKLAIFLHGKFAGTLALLNQSGFNWSCRRNAQGNR